MIFDILPVAVISQAMLGIGFLSGLIGYFSGRDREQVEAGAFLAALSIFAQVGILVFLFLMMRSQG